LTRKFLRFNICILKEPNKAEGKSRGSKTNAKHSEESSGTIANSTDGIARKAVVSRFNTNYVIDVQLVKGTPMVFLDFAHNFFAMIETRIEMQQIKYKNYQNNVGSTQRGKQGTDDKNRLFDLCLETL